MIPIRIILGHRRHFLPPCATHTKKRPKTSDKLEKCYMSTIENPEKIYHQETVADP